MVAELPPTVVLFDFSGVIADEGFRDTLRVLAAEQGADPEAVVRAGRDALHESGYVLGRGSEADFWAAFQGRGALAGDPEDWRERVLAAFRLRPGMLALVNEWRAGWAWPLAVSGSSTTARRSWPGPGSAAGRPCSSATRPPCAGHWPPCWARLPGIPDPWPARAAPPTLPIRPSSQPYGAYP